MFFKKIFFVFSLSAVNLFASDYCEEETKRSHLRLEIESSTPHKKKHQGYKEIDLQGATDVEDFLFRYIFPRTKDDSINRKKIAQIGESLSKDVLEYATRIGFFHQLNRREKVAQLRKLGDVSPITLEIAHNSGFFKLQDPRDRRNILFYLRYTDPETLSLLLKEVDFMRFPLERQIEIFKTLQSIHPESLRLMIDHGLLNFKIVGVNGGYRKKDELYGKIKILNNLKGRTPEFIKSKVLRLATYEMKHNAKAIVESLQIHGSEQLFSLLPLEKQTMIEEADLLDQAQSRDANKMIKSLEFISVEIFSLALEKGFFFFPPRERRNILKALIGMNIEQIESIGHYENSRLLIRALEGALS